MTPRTLILMKAFLFYGRFSDAMSFSRFALLSQKSQFTYWIFSIVWLPRVNCLLLLCKSEASVNKEKHSLCNFAALQSGGATQRNSSLPQTWLLIQKEQILKMTLPQKNCSRIKTPSSKSLILLSFGWKKNVLLINALTNFILCLISLKLVIVGVAFFLGHPVYPVKHWTC